LSLHSLDWDKEVENTKEMKKRLENNGMKKRSHETPRKPNEALPVIPRTSLHPFFGLVPLYLHCPSNQRPCRILKNMLQRRPKPGGERDGQRDQPTKFLNSQLQDELGKLLPENN